MHEDMSKLYAEALTLMKIVSAEGSRDLFNTVKNLESNSVFMSKLKAFLEFALEN
jgi:hypothetical protein